MTAFRATYRLQLVGSFGFAAARELVPYLASLGVSHIYLPPSFEARPGSTHGYDVVDPGRISSALGGEEEFRALVASAREAGLGVVLDIVPNHMAVDGANRYWADPSLREKFFDIDPVTGRHRRFFDIDHLAGVRQEDPEVFEETHRLALALARDGLVDGLRVDHPDGLADPAGYLERLRAEGVEHVWVEKILDPGEKLRDWPVDGTVGYEFLNDACALFVDPAGEAALDALWHEVAGGDARPFGAWAQEAKLEQAAGPFAQDLQRLGRPDLPLAEAASSLPVYRTYVVDSVDEADRAAVREVDPAVARMLLLEDEAPPGFVTRFQQTTPAVMAKGVEDTAFYRYGRLLALNDVGGDPSRFGITVAEFHAANAERAERFPNALLTTQTHDAKRSADVRARIAAVSGMADDWALHVHRWFELNEPLRTAAGAPDRIEEYLLYQTLVGAWPIELERIEAYVEKALREAKRNSSWAKPDERWESGVKAFCRALYDHEPFLADFEPLVERVAAAGERAALAQLVLKLTSPGVPDIYNGDELPYFALVDPDNRRPVDWDRRRELLRRVKAGDASERKLWLIERLLALRARRPEAFAGSYEALDAGPATCAFVRGGEVLVAVPLLGPADASALTLPAGDWADAASIDVFGFTILERPGR
ncbi:MAG: (1-_4)-alpha-D-glucan 1-alpha-D-glucosylmutase [Thermoleophilaceae bacterium]|nr:(1->4)-alpha-D-glucan 1-alpha-D-glucosylmutase [Thermoleophilaceae bacterium]